MVAVVIGISIFAVFIILVCCCIQAQRRPPRKYRTIEHTDGEEGVPMMDDVDNGRKWPQVKEYHDEDDEDDEMQSPVRG